ncbi:hypothetical protein CAEBREN_29110 [Caenorhabditis brenneri]|uniref:Major facilitator superfamily (MFS) profile domain-containing protein n=1 Tax=Caenorhabditis brenneri TaxID=135651 RepID=G0N8U6_CAEBE|nr:hypothetical protein CAEBREN_29110 [Caenorhabditis brenneri]
MKEDMSVMTVFNGTQRSVYDYTGDEKKYILWAVGAGTVFGTSPTNWAVVKYGAKWPFLIAGLVSSFSTTLIPFAAKNNFLFLLFLRFLQGIAYSTDFAAIGVITVRWAPLSEMAFFIALLTCFTGVASMITNSATGLICESSFGWQYAFYIHSFVGLILFALWSGIYVDDPQDTKRISEKELSRIHKNKSAAHLDKNGSVPCFKIFTSPVILVVWLNAFFEMTAVIFFATYMPIYLHHVLKFPVTETGFYVGIILGMNIPLRLVAAAFSDRIKFISEKMKIIIFNTLSVGVSGLALACIGFIPEDENMLSFICIVIVMMFIALNCGGFYKCAALHARQHAHVVIAAIQFTKCLALFSAPFLVAFYVSNESNRIEWIPVFLSLGLSMFAANLISVFVFTDKPAEWTEKKEYAEVPVDESKC